MDRSRSFRHALLRRLIALLGLSIPAIGLATVRPVGAVAVGDGTANAGGDAGEQVALGRPEMVSLTPAERSSLAEAWAADGLEQHASVALFGRFALDLLSVGAPARLVAEAHRAALDEVRHARMCFALAAAYSGEPIVPGPFDFGRGVAGDADPVRLAERTLLEGCVSETLAAAHAAEQLAAATDPAVRKVLGAMAADESRHAELAWRTIGWSLATFGDRVRAPLQDVLDRLEIQRDPASFARGAGAAGASSDALRAHGLLDRAASRSAMERAFSEIVRPCAEAALAHPVWELTSAHA